MARYKMKMIGEIGWSITPESIMEDLSKANGDDIDIDLSSVGGSISKGLIIASLLKDYKKDFPIAKMNLNIKSEASSMASHIAALPIWDHITVEETSLHMIHNPQGAAFGDYQEMESAASFLKRYADVMALEYSRKSKKSLNQTKKDMDKTTYLFGKEIVDSGFADEVLTTGQTMEKDMAISMMQTKFKTVMKKIRDENIDQNELEKVSKMISMSDKSSDDDYDMLEIHDIEMPYPNEHAARIVQPDKFIQNSFRRKNITAGIDIIIGKLKGETSTTTQAYRFSIDNFTADEAKQWLKDHDIKYISFEAATNKPKAQTQEPAPSGKNNQEDDIVKDINELKDKHPEIHAEAMEAGKSKGKEEMIANIKAIMDFRNQPEYKNLQMVQERCDKALEKGENISDLKMAVSAILLDPKMQAVMDSPGVIGSGNDTTVSGEEGNLPEMKSQW